MLIHKKIITCIKEKNDHDFEPFISFEFYPPKTEKAIQTLKEKLKRLKHQSPLYIDFTWAAGGSSSDLTVELSKFAAELGFEVNMHLTCTNMDIDKISTALKDAKKFDIKNICALRGDPPIGSDNWISGSSGFLNALDLINYINSEYPNYFGIQVAGYPEGHPDKIHPVGIKELSKTEKSRIANVEIKIEEVKDMKNIHPSSLYVKNKINQDLNPSIINPAALSLFCNTKKKSYSSKWVPHVCSDNDY